MSIKLQKDTWTKSDIKEFLSYLDTLSKGIEKAKWEQKILNTKMKCIAVPSKEVDRIIKDISKGNFLGFVDLWIWDNYTCTSINGKLICKIKDFSLMEKYLDIYASKCDNWASVDCLKFNIKPTNKQQYFNLSLKYIKSDLPFVRRLGITILFKLVDDDKYINQIFEILNLFTLEKEYYVNMVNAWLVAECFTKQRDKTLGFLEHHKLNKFTINKAISKCRDSFRISKEDKEMLLKYRA